MPQRSATFVLSLAKTMGIAVDRIVLVQDGARDYFTSSLAYSFDQARGAFAAGDIVLIVEVAAGIHVACALYQV